MTYAYPAWEFAAETDLLKLQRLQLAQLANSRGARWSAICIWLSKFRTFTIT
jgi:hypothetical protein